MIARRRALIRRFKAALKSYTQHFSGALPPEFAVSGGGVVETSNGRLRIAVPAGYIGGHARLERVNGVPSMEGKDYQVVLSGVLRVPAVTEQYTNIHLRQQDSPATRLSLEWVGDGEIYETVNGVYTSIAYVTMGQPDTEHVLDFRAVGSTLGVRFYPVGATPPAYVTVNTTIPKTGTVVDVRVVHASGASLASELRVDQLLVQEIDTPPPAGSSLTKDQAGVSADLTWGSLTNAEITDQVNKMKASGVRHCRLNLSWNMLETASKGTYNTGNLAMYDHAINSLVNAGIKILATFGHSVPYWASADPNKSGGTSWDSHWRPVNWSDWADHCIYLMNRWGSKIEIVQIWNEPNNGGFWPSQSTEQAKVTEYKQMLESGYNAVKSVNPNMPVAHGGFSHGANYLALHYLYQAGGKPFFNLGATHLYTNDVDPTLQWTETSPINGATVKAKASFTGIDTFRQVMVDNGDSAKNIVITEWGWTTTTGTGGVSEAQQASFLGSGWDLMAARSWIVRSYLYLMRETTFSGQAAPYGSDWVNKFGIVTPTLVDKPARSTFTTKAGV